MHSAVHLNCCMWIFFKVFKNRHNYLFLGDTTALTFLNTLGCVDSSWNWSRKKSPVGYLRQTKYQFSGCYRPTSLLLNLNMY